MIGLRTTPREFIEKYFSVRNEQGKVVPFILREEQKIFLDQYVAEYKERGYVRLIVLKARQVGISTLVAALNLIEALVAKKGVQILIMTHSQETTITLMDRIRMLYELLPEKMRNGYKLNNKKTIAFKNGSEIRGVVSSHKGTSGLGSTVQHFHASEVAFFNNAREQLNAVKQTIAEQPNTSIILESTAKGFNTFKELWEEANCYGHFRPVFIPWYRVGKYVKATNKGIASYNNDAQLEAKMYNLTPEQLEWREQKLSECGSVEAFNELYPSSQANAFIVKDLNSLIDLQSIMTSIKREPVKVKRDEAIMGVDFATPQGADNSTIVIRNKDIIQYSKIYKDLSLEYLLEEILKLVKAFNVKRVCPDADGLGLGYAVQLRDRLGSMVVYVKGATRAMEYQTYENTRAENWSQMKQWIEEYGILPNDNVLIAQLTSVAARAKAGRLCLESKNDIKRIKGLPSPDLADALANTFILGGVIKKNSNDLRSFLTIIN